MIFSNTLIFLGGFAVAFFVFYLPTKVRLELLKRKTNSPLPATPNRKVVGSSYCDFDDCSANDLEDCVSDFCHRHCATKCRCGAGDEAVNLIKKYGSLRRAERELPFEMPEIMRLEIEENKSEK